MSAPILFAAEGLTKRYAGLEALSGVGFTLGAGEVLGLIGPNGAGKTTLVNVISGMQLPEEGEIRFAGRRIDRLPPHRRAHLGIGRTFQVTKPFPGLSVRDNVTMGALFGRDGGVRAQALARDQAVEWIEFVGLMPRLDQHADTLGGPDRKRLELAKALAMRPRLLLLDEVMAGLTPTEIELVVPLIKKIRDRGVAILVIEHVVSAIRSLSDRILVLQNGRKIAEGLPDAVLRDPAVVEAYLGRRRS